MLDSSDAKNIFHVRPNLLILFVKLTKLYGIQWSKKTGLKN
jgi:hypothetical protein